MDMPTLEESIAKDAAELQHVLTRYLDSHDGYRQVAEVAASASWAEAFLEIADRRQAVASQVASLILRQGEKVKDTGSTEAVIHRWWIRFRSQLSDEELRILLEECVRGETELSKAAHEALEHGNLIPAHAAIIREVAAEVDQAIVTFRRYLG